MRKYNYPNAPLLQVKSFRTRDGRFAEADLKKKTERNKTTPALRSIYRFSRCIQYLGDELMKQCMIWPICLAVLIFSCSKKQENKSAEDQRMENRTVATIPPDTRILTKINGKWGYTNANGDTIISSHFDEAQEFAGGLARVKFGDKWTFITGAGKMITSPQFDEVGNFHEGLARVKLGDKWGFIKFNGEIVVSPQFDEAADFHDSMARVKHGNKWGYIDRAGKLAVFPKFDETGDFDNGLARVRLGEKWGCIEGKGIFVRDLRSDEIVNCSEVFSRVAVFSGERRIEITFVDTAGTMPLFASLWAGSLPEGLIPILVNDKWGYADSTGKIVIKPQHYGVGEFSEGLAPVLSNRDGPLKYIDKTGEIVAVWNVDSVASTQNQTVSEVFLQAGDTLHVLARSGLELKQAPDPNAATVGVVPYGERVIVLEDTKERVAFEQEDITGHWILAKHGNETGYIFDGFLSKLPAPPEDCGSLEAYVNAMLTGVGKREIVYALDSQIELQRCRYGAVFKIWKPEESCGTVIILTIPNIRLEEGFLIAKLCYGKDKNVARAVFPKGAEEITITFEEEIETAVLTLEKTKDGNIRIKYH